MSNLLKDASILLTPTGYDNGSMNAIKPENGDGDFTFSRNSAATRVNAQGLVENVQILSSDLVSNGDFSQEGVQEVSNGSFSQEGAELVTNGSFTNGSTDWNLRNAWVVSNGICSLNPPNSDYLSQSNVLTSNKSYKLTFDIIVNSGNLQPQFFDGGWQTIGTYSTTQTVEVYFKSTSSGALYFKPNSFTGSIDNVSVKEVGQDWTTNDWNISGGYLNGSASTGIVFQSNLGTTIGKTYKVTLETSNYVSGSIRFKVGGGSYENISSINGVQEFYFVAATSANNILFAVISAYTGSITNISVKEVGQDWTIINGTITDKYNASMTAYQSGVRITPFTKIGTFKVVFDLVVTSGSCKFDAGGSNNAIYSTSGTKEIIVTDTNKFEFNAFNLGWVGTLDNISVIEITDDTNLPRINYEGFSYQDSLGSELIVNGTFDSDTAWNKLNATISGGTGNLNGTGVTSLLYQNILTNGKTYKVTFTVSDYNSLGEARIIESSGSAIYTITSNGTFTFTFTHSNADGNFLFRARTGAIFSIDNVSVKEYLGQEVVPNSGCGSWLLEPQSTNLIAYSEAFDNAYWTKSGASVVSGFTSPSGEANAFKVVNNSVVGSHHIKRTSSIPVSSNATYTYSVYLKKGTKDVITIEDGAQFFGLASFNLTSKTATNLSGTNARIEEMSNGWFRCSVSVLSTSTGLRFTIYSGTTSSGIDDSGDYYIYGAQIEQQSYATSYIPTSGASSTRLQDIATNSGNASLINSEEGVLYAEISALANDQTDRLISITNGTASERISLFYGSGVSNQIKGIVFSGGALSANLSFISSNITNLLKVAISYKLNDFALWVNGIKVATDTSGLTPSVLNTLSFDLGTSSTFLPFYGKTKALAVYKTALTDEQLTLLTTI
jgi:hypothetical protein